MSSIRHISSVLLYSWIGVLLDTFCPGMNGSTICPSGVMTRAKSANRWTPPDAESLSTNTVLFRITSAMTSHLLRGFGNSRGENAPVLRLVNLHVLLEVSALLCLRKRASRAPVMDDRHRTPDQPNPRIHGPVEKVRIF